MAFKTRVSGLDFKPRPKKRRVPRPQRWHWIALGISGVVAVASLLSTRDDAGAMPERAALQQLPAQTLAAKTASRTLELPIPKRRIQDLDDPSAAPPLLAYAPGADSAESSTAPHPLPSALRSLSDDDRAGSEPEDPQGNWQAVRIKPGDSLAAIFQKRGLSPKAVFAVTHVDNAPGGALERLFPGDKIWLRISDDGALLALRRKLDETRTLTITRGSTPGAAFHAETAEHALERRSAHATAVIHDSLYQAALRAGLDEKLIMELTGIFGWDIDFVHDVRSGDSFALVYRQYYKNGEKIRNGEIITAEFTNQGKRYRAVRYTDPKGRVGYYTPEGKSMRKAFLRTPVDFRRISSHFSKSRCHPVLHVCRPHEGTDFAAATGTPIQAAGDGVVAFAGRKGGYGNAVILHHGHNYSTLYGHMKRIRKGIRAGVRLSQGQIIGYVGQSGLATGPHLHYEFRVNGVPRDVLKVALPDAKPIDDRYLADFKDKAVSRLARLAVITRTQLASNEESK